MEMRAEVSCREALTYKENILVHNFVFTVKSEHNFHEINILGSEASSMIHAL